MLVQHRIMLVVCTAILSQRRGQSGVCDFKASTQRKQEGVTVQAYGLTPLFIYLLKNAQLLVCLVCLSSYMLR